MAILNVLLKADNLNHITGLNYLQVRYIFGGGFIKLQLLKLRDFLLRKFLPLFFICSFLVSCFIIFPNAEIVSTNEFKIVSNSYSDFFTLASAPYNNEFSFENTSNPEWNSPVIRSDSFYNAIDTLTLAFKYSSTLQNWFNSNGADNESVKVTIPFVFYNSSSSTHYVPPSKVSVSLRSSSGTTFDLGTFEPSFVSTSYTVFNLVLNYTNDFNSVSSSVPILFFNFTVPNNGNGLDVVYGGLSPYSIGGSLFDNVVFEVDFMPNPPSYANPDTDNWESSFGNGLNDYFAAEGELNSIVDHNFINSFLANVSSIQNEFLGLAALRRLFNEFWSYNFSQYTWLNNLLEISLFFGIVTFILGIAAYYFGHMNWGKKK